MKFVLDNTVGKLARLLRMAGFDTAYVAEDAISRVIAISREQERMIVSRNSRYEELTLVAAFHHVESDMPAEQLFALLSRLALDLEEDRFLSRCLECNEPLEKVNKQEVAGHVWPYVWKTQNEFRRCPGCARIYWRATHVEAMQEKLMRIKSELDQMRRNRQ
ncbi:MAG: Mut7-C RNAse domain-containing protein [bacterium]